VSSTLAFEELELEPFGLVVTVPEGTAWSALDPETLHRWVTTHRVLVLRGLAAVEKRHLPAAARRLGPLLAWSFGAINELRPQKDTKSYLFTNREVPLHWDGAFVGRIPRYLFFHCLEAPEVDGGETVFVNTTRVWERADPATRDRWRSLRFIYETERVVHYGGRFESPVVAEHPFTHETVLRFAEPVDDLNPVAVRAEGLDPLESARRITELQTALATPEAVLLHAWRPGDVVLGDNHALLHGRRPFPGGERRHLRRINICGPERTWRDALLDSVRIRRPEFMVAELPILLIPALLSGGIARLGAASFAELSILFFLLFHFGDMINCLADRDLDAVYKTHLSEAVYGLGVRNVEAQLRLTVLGAVALAAHLAVVTARPEIVLLVVVGLALGAAYSVGPLRLKSRGILQVLCLWAVIFVGPMLLVARTLGASLATPLLALVLSYGAMQEGIILMNTAEDLPEDRAWSLRTTADALGLDGCLLLSVTMVGAGGLATIGSLGWLGSLATPAHGSIALGVVPLVGAWAWVTWEIGRTWHAVRALRGRPLADAIAALRPRARRMPLWITATAWTSLWAAVWASALRG
jgi:alpha-ketoglutarate-dependent taurine dioxygenase